MTYTVAGLMSGSSLDGLDIAICQINDEAENWSYNILKADTVAYPNEWISRLQQAATGSVEDFIKTDTALGKWMGRQAGAYIKQSGLPVDFVASHGHTVLHQPQGSAGYTSQIGHGAWLAAEAGLSVVCDFRTTDVALGGQGAPLVPIGDKLLFGDYAFCLNLGGIANFTYTHNQTVWAYDICGCNILLNYLATKLQLPYDADGQLAAQGKVNSSLLDKMNKWPFLQQKPPRSLGREDVESYFFNLLNDESVSLNDRLATACHHIAEQIATQAEKQLKQNRLKTHGKATTGLITGGGAFNNHLMGCLKKQSPNIEWAVPESLLVQYKEALIFCLLGVLRQKNQPNTLAAVTGAARDNCGGCIYIP